MLFLKILIEILSSRLTSILLIVPIPKNLMVFTPSRANHWPTLVFCPSWPFQQAFAYN